MENPLRTDGEPSPTEDGDPRTQNPSILPMPRWRTQMENPPTTQMLVPIQMENPARCITITEPTWRAQGLEAKHIKHPDGPHTETKSVWVGKK